MQTPRVANVLDQSNTSLIRSPMIIASIINEEDCSSFTMTSDPPVKSIVLSKSIDNHDHYRLRQETASIKVSCLLGWKTGGNILFAAKKRKSCL